jgi:hypothetical protein
MEKTNDKREYRRAIAVFQKADGKTYDYIAREHRVHIRTTKKWINVCTPTAHAQTQGGCPGESHTGPSGTHFCGNPHSPEFSTSVPRPPPLPSCTSPNSVAISLNPISGACRITPKP